MLKTEAIQDLIDRKALFVINHSGGKDSQAMMIEMLKAIPADQLLVVHASLGEIEWEGALEMAQTQAADAGVPFLVARARKSFLEMVAHRFETRPEVPSFPSKSCRTCTSDLKRNPINSQILGYMKARGLKLVVNCEGIRAQESDDRAKREPFEHLNLKLSKKTGRPTSPLARAGRDAYYWAPIFELSTAEVFAIIAAAGQKPHWAYAKGNERLSCVFCIFGSKGDLARGAAQYPDLFAKYVAMEQRTGYTMHMSRKSLTELVAEAKL